jgi:hypothetical protein
MSAMTNFNPDIDTAEILHLIVITNYTVSLTPLPTDFLWAEWHTFYDFCVTLHKGILPTVIG